MAAGSGRRARRSGGVRSTSRCRTFRTIRPERERTSTAVPLLVANGCSIVIGGGGCNALRSGAPRSGGTGLGRGFLRWRRVDDGAEECVPARLSEARPFRATERRSGTPDVLLRFHRAVIGLGRIAPLDLA